MSVIYKSKSEMRAESEKALADFLRAGGSIQVIESKRRAPKQKMRAKGTRSSGGSSNLGFRTSSAFRGV